MVLAAGSDSGWWSPDDSEVLYRTETSLGMVGVDGTGDRPFVDFVTGGSTPFADWSPDGSRIAYVDPDLDGIWVANVDGSGPQKIRDGYGYNVPRFLGPARPTGPCTDSDPRPECDRFDIVVIGDSIAAGQGLDEAHRYSTLVADRVAALTGEEVRVHDLAHSGAGLLGPCVPAFGREVPQLTPSVACQLAAAAAADVDYELVLFSGCINDIGVVELLAGTSDPSSAVRDLCGPALRDQVAAAVALPGGPLVAVTGYYQFVSARTVVSALPNLSRLCQTGAGAGPLCTVLVGAALVRAAVRNGEFVRAFDNLATRTARDLGGQVLFVSPEFSPANALYAPRTLLWGFGQDEQQAVRAQECVDAGRGTDAVCLNAAVGHPNVAGARQYADMIIAAVDDRV